ncbi:MAG: ABC transporter substrate-binding protein, partial [Desulfobacteria bacterium]
MEKKLFIVGYKTLLMFIILGVYLLVGERLGYTEEVRGVTKDEIKIAAIGDQTGPAASVGIPIVEATKLYFRNINDQGGINGRKVKFIVEDDHYTIPGALSAFKKLIYKDRVLSILYCGGTGQTVTLMRHIEKEKVPVITVSLAETMTTPVKRYIFTPSSSYDDGLKIIIDYIMKDIKAKTPKIAIVYPDLEFGKTGLDATEKYLQRYNLKLADKEVLALSAIDATSQVLSLKRSKPDYIILHNAAAAIVSFLKGAKKYDLKIPIYGSFYVSSEDTISIAGSASEGLIAVSPYGYWFDDTTGMVQMRKIAEKYQPGTKPKIRNYTQGWVTSMICAEGLKRAGRDLTPDTLVDAYETFRNFSTGDVSGPVSYSKTDHKGGRTNKLYKTDIEKQT